MNREPRGKGNPGVPGKFSEVLTRKQADEANVGWPEHLQHDGKGADNRISPPPWNDDQLQFIQDNLNLLRVDPTSVNSVAHGHSAFVTALLGYPDERTKHCIAEDMAELLSEHDAHTIQQFFGQIVKLAECRDQPSHGSFQTLRAYYDFVRDSGFDPTPRKLSDFITSNPEAYPVGKAGKSASKQWDDAFGDLLARAGLARLAEKSPGI